MTGSPPSGPSLRARRSMRLGLAIVLAVLATTAWQISAAARATPGVAAVPQVRVTARSIEFHGDRALLVRSLTVTHIANVRLRVTCEHCVRYPTPIRETKPSAGTKRFGGVNWIIEAGRHIHLSVTRQGRIGRYLTLGVGGAHTPERNSLVVTRSGCLNDHLRAIACPRHVRSPSKGAHVKGGSPKVSDSTPPAAPSGLAVTATSETTIAVGWRASTDDVAVSGYALQRDSTRVATATGLAYTFAGLSCGHSYRLGVAAYDAAGNLSASSTIVASTAPCPPSDRLSHEGSLLAATSQYLQSADGRIRLIMQADSNLVLYGPNGALWSSNTLGMNARELRMQNDGSLVIYNTNSQPIWAITETSHHYNAYLVVQNDGNLVIYENGIPLWSTGTTG